MTLAEIRLGGSVPVVLVLDRRPQYLGRLLRRTVDERPPRLQALLPARRPRDTLLQEAAAAPAAPAAPVRRGGLQQRRRGRLGKVVLVLPRLGDPVAVGGQERDRHHGRKKRRRCLSIHHKVAKITHEIREALLDVCGPRARKPSPLRLRPRKGAPRSTKRRRGPKSQWASRGAKRERARSTDCAPSPLVYLWNWFAGLAAHAALSVWRTPSSLQTISSVKMLSKIGGCWNPHQNGCRMSLTSSGRAESLLRGPGPRPFFHGARPPIGSSTMSTVVVVASCSLQIGCRQLAATAQRRHDERKEVKFAS